MSLSIFRIICILPLLLPACKDISRDNPLDPKNPAAYQPHTVSIEVFINTNDSIPYNYNFEMLAALDQIKQKYDSHVSLVEYHRNVQDYEDPDHSVENEALYTKYVDSFKPGTKGVPDVFINGTTSRVQGAYDAGGTTLFRLEQALGPLLVQNSGIAIEPELGYSGNSVIIAARIGVLGETVAGKIIVRTILISDGNDVFHQRVAKKILRSSVSPWMVGGEVRKFEIGTITISGDGPHRLVFQVVPEDELFIFQSKEVELP